MLFILLEGASDKSACGRGIREGTGVAATVGGGGGGGKNQGEGSCSSL
jgi:hypothetical protein